MRFLKLSAVLMAAVLFVIALATSGQSAPRSAKRGGDSGPPGRGKEETVEFSLVQIGDDDIQVVSARDAAQMKKTVAEEDKRRLKAYEDAKKAAKNKSKTKNNDKGKSDISAPIPQPDAVPLEKPTKRKVTVLKEHIKSMPEAEMLRDQYIQDGKLDKNSKSKKTPAR